MNARFGDDYAMLFAFRCMLEYVWVRISC